MRMTIPSLGAYQRISRARYFGEDPVGEASSRLAEVLDRIEGAAPDGHPEGMGLDGWAQVPLKPLVTTRADDHDPLPLPRPISEPRPGSGGGAPVRRMLIEWR